MKINFIYKDTTESTNNDIKILAEENAPEGTVVLSEHQTDGKGRLGKTFFSPKGNGIYFSILLRPKCLPHNYCLITVAASVAVCRAVENIFGTSCAIKWVNDIYFENKKFCGILTESKISYANTLSYAVLGIGINLTVPESGYPEEFSYKTTALSEFTAFNPHEYKEQLVCEILKEFDVFYKDLESKKFLDEYKNRSCVIGKNIDILSDNKKTSAVAIDIDDNANLIVKTHDGKIKALNSGDISISL